jgi:heptose I phosphotransferase
VKSVFRIHPAFQEIFAEAGLTKALDFFQLPNLRILRELPQRTNLYWSLQKDSKQYGFYLKTHKPLSFWQAFWNLLGFKHSEPPGCQEWENILLLQAHQIPTLQAVAVGVLPGRWGKRSGASFVMTEELYGYLQLDHYFQKHPLTPRLLDKMADLARRFHEKGFCHKDFYLCHWFYHPNTEDLVLIDLQRVKRPWFFRRWKVKDLAELYYSSKDLPLTQTMKLRFFRKYLGLKRREPWKKSQKTLLLNILKKNAQIEFHNRTQR